MLAMLCNNNIPKYYSRSQKQALRVIDLQKWSAQFRMWCEACWTYTSILIFYQIISSWQRHRCLQKDA